MAKTATARQVSVAIRFFDHWNAGRIDDALLMLSDEVIYQNVPLPSIIGCPAARAFHRERGIGTEFTVAWQLTHVAVSGNAVLNERVDVFLHKDGGSIIRPVMGARHHLDTEYRANRPGWSPRLRQWAEE